MSEKLLSGKFAKHCFCSLLAGTLCIFKGAEAAQFPSSYIGHPAVSGFVVRDAFHAASVVNSPVAIAEIFGVSGDAEIVDSVIPSIQIAVVNSRAIGDGSMHIDPRQSVQIMQASADAHLRVSNRFIHRAAWLPNSGPLTTVCRSQTCKYPSFWVVADKLPECVLCNFHVTRAGDVGTKSC